MGVKYQINGSITLSALVKPPVDPATIESEQVLYELLIKTPIGPNREAEQIITVPDDEDPTKVLVLSEDETRWEYNFIPTRAGTHYFRFQYVGTKQAADEEDFLVKGTQFAAYI